jgi:hypothetical protein
LHLKIDFCHFSENRSPVNGALYHAIPGRVLVFRPPGGGVFAGQGWRDKDGRRDFQVSFLAELLLSMGAKEVVQLGEAEYDPDDFLAAGITHKNLQRLSAHVRACEYAILFVVKL